MTAKKLTVKLTKEQQKQIRDATGKNISELTVDLAATGELTEKDLEHVAGGEATDKDHKDQKFR